MVVDHHPQYTFQRTVKSSFYIIVGATPANAVGAMDGSRNGDEP